MIFYKEKETGWICSPWYDRRGFEDDYDEITLQELIDIVDGYPLWSYLDQDVYDYIFEELKIETEDRDIDEVWQEVKRYAGL